MTPGILDRRLDLKPVSRVSPSRYEAMKECALREVWAAGGQPVLLPLTPAARLGTAIHQLLEEAGRGQLVPPIERRWQALMDEAEDAMRASWLEKHFVPLRSSVRDFEVRRLRAQDRAHAITQAISSGKSGQERTPAGFEQWVATLDGSVGGFIDHVVETPDGPVLRDYKSGNIYGGTGGSPRAGLKDSFVVQLRLYAALYAASTQRWPARLEIVPLQGDAVHVPFDPAECEDLLADASALLARTNATILELAPDYAAARLANPNVRSCKHCPFRPACMPYRQVRMSATEEAAWPDDVWGELREMRQLGNGKLLLTVTTDASSGKTRHIRGVTANPTRHPALQHLKEGDPVGIFSLKHAATGGTLSETPWSVMYNTLI